MAVLIDPARWPAHGTVFSHLVSDASLAELHAFAEAARIPRRAFDGDHYDVPVERYAELVALGAHEVEGAELVRRLVASGLRIPAAQRPGKLDKILIQRFNRLLPGHSPLERDPVVADLLARWSEPHRHYHDRSHLLAVLKGIDLLVRHGEDCGRWTRSVKLAAWFHDAVYLGDPERPAGQDEEDSAVLAETTLSDLGLPDPEIEQTARLVRMTATHDPDPEDRPGAVLSDADLEVLGRGHGDYARYLAAVRRDYAHVPDGDFARGRAAVVRSLLEQQPLYRTATGARLWEGTARRNLSAELHPTSRHWHRPGL
jgi:predicted metal-dependent HD superfamily phosphohydrolase